MSVLPSPPKKRISTLAVLILLLLRTSVSYPLSTDKEQDIIIEADSAEMHNLENTMIYRGNVVVTQGSMRMTGDSLEILFDQESNIKLAIMQGNLATYRQLPDNQTLYDEAEARQMEYHVPENYVLLIEQAQIKREGMQISGDHIQYDVNQRVIKAKKNETDSSEDAIEDTRIKITIKNAASMEKQP